MRRITAAPAADPPIRANRLRLNDSGSITDWPRKRWVTTPATNGTTAMDPSMQARVRATSRPISAAIAGADISAGEQLCRIRMK